jgi:hypothetical protein
MRAPPSPFSGSDSAASQPAAFRITAKVFSSTVAAEIGAG